MQIDFRDVYASVLKDWFQADATQIQSMFEHTVNFFPILDACNLGMAENEGEKELLIFPNPCVDYTSVRFSSKGERVTIQVRDISGQLVLDVCNREIENGVHVLPLEVSDLAPGTYVVSIYKRSGNFTERFIKVRQN
jgi:hypothetical protein